MWEMTEKEIPLPVWAMGHLGTQLATMGKLREGREKREGWGG